MRFQFLQLDNSSQKPFLARSLEVRSMKTFEIVSLPELAHSVELSQSVEQLTTLMYELDKSLQVTEQRRHELCRMERIDSVSATTTYWQWRASVGGKNWETEERGRAEFAAIDRALKIRDESRLSYYGAKLKTIARVKALRQLIDKTNATISTIRSTLDGSPLDSGLNFLHKEIAVINILTAEKLVSQAEAKWQELRFHWDIRTETIENGDGTKTVKVLPEIDNCGPNDQSRINLHIWLQNLYESYERKYFVHYGCGGNLTPEEAPSEGLMTLFEADYLLYGIDVCDFKCGINELYEVRDGKPSPMGPNFGLFRSRPLTSVPPSW